MADCSSSTNSVPWLLHTMLWPPGTRRRAHVGHWPSLRRLRLDELPQLFNILFGEMSLIGPRPLLPSISQLPMPRGSLSGLDLPVGHRSKAAAISHPPTKARLISGTYGTRRCRSILRYWLSPCRWRSSERRSIRTPFELLGRTCNRLGLAHFRIWPLCNPLGPIDGQGGVKTPVSPKLT